MPLLTDAELDDEIAKDWKEISGRHRAEEEGEAPAKGGKGEAAEVDETAPEEGAEGAAEREGAADDASAAAEQPRDKSGRYKPAPKAKGRADAAAARTEAEGEQPRTEERPEGQQPQRQEGQQQPAARDLTRPPSTWSPKERAAWANVPAEARAAIHRREADFINGQRQLMGLADYGRELAQVIQPYQMLIDSEGGTPAAAVQDLLRTAAVLRTGTEQQKYQTIANIANRFGINLRLFGTPPQQQQQGGAPRPIPPQQQFRDPRVDTLLQSMQTEVQQRAAAEQRDTETLVTRWMNATDRQGNPLRPYANDVLDDMVGLVPLIKQADPTLTHAQALDAAYERATWANPEIRALLQAQQNPANDPARRAESQRRAGEARRAASGNVPRRAGLSRRPPAGTMEETIAETARDLGLISSS